MTRAEAEAYFDKLTDSEKYMLSMLLDALAQRKSKSVQKEGAHGGA